MAGYIGSQPVPQATQVRESFTATTGQTQFNTSGYTPGYIDVFLNGVRIISGVDYYATNGIELILADGAAEGDVLETIAYSTFDAAQGAVGAALGSGTDQIFWENDTTITADYTITTGKNAGTFGPVTIADNVIVTIPDGSTWTII